jgi:hypothetical protein
MKTLSICCHTNFTVVKWKLEYSQKRALNYTGSEKYQTDVKHSTFWGIEDSLSFQEGLSGIEKRSIFQYYSLHLSCTISSYLCALKTSIRFDSDFSCTGN